MSTEFAHALLFQGRLLVSAEPALALTEADLEVLRSALRIQSLHLPGTPLEGSLPVLVKAIQVVYRLGWRVLNAELTPTTADPSLRMPAGPRSPEEHLGGDVAFRFLPGLYQRALSRDPEDQTAQAIEAILRQWPLSGVLADIAAPPETALDFGGHVGLGFLYAERLAARERPGWFPRGPLLECVEVVYHSLGRRRPEDAPAAGVRIA